LENKEVKNKLAVKAGIWYVIAQLFVRSISFIATPVFSRLLTTAQFGQVKVFESWLQILLPILSLSLYSSVEKAMYEFKGELDEFLSSIQFLTIITTGFFILISIPFHKNILNFLGINDVLLSIIFLYCFTHAAISNYQKREKLFYRYKTNIRITFLVTVPSFLCAIAAVVWGKNNGFESSLHQFRIIAFYIPQIIVGLIIAITMIKEGKCLYRKDFWKFAISFSLPMIPHFIALQILNQSDKIMIEKLCDSSKVGLFSLASTIMYILYLLQSSIGDAFLPWLYEQLDEKEFDEIKKPWFIITIGCSILSWVIVLYAPEIIYILGGKKYQEAIFLVPPIVCGALFQFFSSIYTNIERFYRKTKVIAVASCLAVVFNLLLNYFGIQFFGYSAAAYTTVICYLIMVIGHGVMVKHITGMFIVPLKQMLLIAGVALLLNVCTMRLYQFHLLFRIGIGLVSMVIILLWKKKEIKEMIGMIKK